jgi:CRISPR-associated protein Cas1
MYRFILLAGLNPTVGFIHHGRTDRPNLLFDMVEEFRQPLVDRAVFRLLRRKMRLGMDGLLLDHTTKHKLVSAMADNLGSPVYYNAGRPGLRVAMEGQVQKLVGFLKNGERYRPFIFH